MTELTNYQEWQLHCYGDILPESGDTEEISDLEAERSAEWMAINAERNLWEYENSFI